MSDPERTNFKAHSHVLRLLGEQLVGNDRLAVFELVKNSYDADADWAKVTLEIRSNKKPCIRVEDNGCGMNLDTIKKGWFVLGGDLKRGANRKRSEIWNRVPLGEKGIGRLSAFRLGTSITVHTRAHQNPEYSFTVELPVIKKMPASLEELDVEVNSDEEGQYFKSGQTGTNILILGLNRENWTRGAVRDLYRMMTTLVSPFQDTSTSFKTILDVPGHDDWLEDIYEPEEIAAMASWQFSFNLDEDGFTWTYRFTPPTRFKTLQPRTIKYSESEYDKSLPLLPEEGTKPKRKKKMFFEPSMLKNIGPVKGEVLLFFRRREILGPTRQVKKYLDENTGVRVYRDGIRVYNYGEPGDDWLGLDSRRILKPAARMGTKSVIAAIHLDHAKSQGLHEKTNREGFSEDATFKRFKRLVLSIMSFLDLIRQDDREALANVIRTQDAVGEPGPALFEKAMHELRAGLRKKKLEVVFERNLSALEREYNNLRNFTLSSGLSGLNISMIFHEVERETRQLLEDILHRRNYDMIVEKATHLRKMLRSVTSILKAPRTGTHLVSQMLERVKDVNEARFRVHKIDFNCPVLSGTDNDFKIKGSLSLYAQVLNNLIDNSIYWIRWRREKEGLKQRGLISIRTLPDWGREGSCLAVIDNGSGFSISPEKAVEPFCSTKLDGMGLGLFFAKLGMESHGGKLLIVHRSDLDIELEPELDGAAVLLCFAGDKKK